MHAKNNYTKHLPHFLLPARVGSVCTSKSGQYICKSNSERVQGVCIRGPLKMQSKLHKLKRVQCACMQSWNEVTGSCPRCKYPKPDKPAFSLVEMLMALLVASLLLAALAPVITKRLGSENIDVSMSGDLSEKKVCGYINDTYEDIKAEDCIAPDDAYRGSAIIVSGSGGGAGGTDTAVSENKVLTYNGTTGASSSGIANTSQYEFAFNKNINHIRFDMVAGGGGGGGGNYNANFAGGTSGCEKITGTDTLGKSSYATYDSANKLCVTKYNQVSNPSDHATYKVTGWSDTKCTSSYEHTGRCNANQNSMAYAYSGCSRPVCTHAGAVAACSKLASDTKLSWRLPTKEELGKWSSSYATRFALCTSADSGTLFNMAAYCNYSGNYAYGGVGGNGLTDYLYFHAHPFELWTNTAYSATHYWGGFYRTYYDVSGFMEGWPLSVRCVASSEYNLFTGGGGGGSSFLGGQIPKDVLNYATSDNNSGLLKIYVGAGGKGGTKQTGSGGVVGSPSRLEVYAKKPDGSTEIIWALQIEGGYQGYGAGTNSAGKGGYTREYGKCSYLHKSVAGGNYNTEVSGKCAEMSGTMQYGPGYSGMGTNGDHATTPGYGGAAPWFENGFNAGRITPANTAGTVGSGGGGGICSVADNGAVSCTDGASGGGGRVQITYTTKAPGIGGSGGGGGGLLHIVNFEIKPKEKVKIQTGKKGKGGSGAVNGSDGGESYIEVNGKKYSVSGGSGGKTGTAGTPPVDNLSEPTMPIAGNVGIGGKSNVDVGAKFNGGDGSPGTVGINGDMNLSSGGNGGINSKISMLADIPCGGLSTTPVGGAACNRSSNIPVLLTRSLTKDDFNSAFKSTYGAGGSGGGGGGWNNGLSEGTRASSGADGLGGYVFVYFGGW